MKLVNYVTQGFFYILAITLLSCTNSSPTPTGNIDDNKGTTQGARACKGDNVCEEICEDIYDDSSRNTQNECKKLSFVEVERIQEVHDLLEKPDLEDLLNINAKDFKKYISISDKAIDNHIKDWTRRHMEGVLTWIAVDESVADVFSNEDDEYKWLKKILGKIGGGDNADGYKKALEERLDNGTFIETALNPRNADKVSSSANINKKALSLIHDFIEDERVGDCPADPDSESDKVDCLKLYCDLAVAMDNDNIASDWVSLDGEFNKYIDKVIDNGINGSKSPTSSQWNTGNIDDIDEDLSARWWNDLC